MLLYFIVYVVLLLIIVFIDIDVCVCFDVLVIDNVEYFVFYFY